ncbi:MAG TPA: hypothetical protein VM076_17095 [Gemmatimonadaceae bacterium]|nr:hypothetical protein [Gemmatimonadaceae bacterium]
MTASTVQPLVLAAVIGALSGTHTAIWGMYKDAIHEGFTVRQFVRSVIVGALVAVVIQRTLRLTLPSAAGVIVLFGLAYAAERGIVEVWKTFVRDEDQSKYTIPMQFSLHGAPVRSRGARFAAGVGYVTVVALSLFAVTRVELGPLGTPTFLRSAMIGLTVGAIIAFGGAWKDAPTEGFDMFKFFRSPCLTVLFAMLLSALTTSYLQIAVAAIGYERATAETYKTFFFPSKPRGKFAGKPVLFPEMVRRRHWFVPAYVAIWAIVLVAGVLALGDA